MTHGLMALHWTEKLMAFAVLLQTVELLQLRRKFSENGIWRWSLLRQDFLFFPKPVFRVFDFLLQDSAFLKALWLRGLAALALLFFPYGWLVAVLFFTTLLICLRWRGVFNGGSDYMTMAVLLALLIAHFVPNGTLAGFWYIVVQVTLSYVLAGWVKLKNPEWRNGKALPEILEETSVGLSVVFQKSKTMAVLGSWAVIVFEITFPLTFINGHWALAYLTFGFCFHLLNFYFFGLNRFFWAWTATYPVLYYCSTHLI